jgi:glycosyltransferase involved in cell wall biosynthesis
MPGHIYVRDREFEYRATVMPSVAILLCTFNGERFLAAQLSSFITQCFKNWRLFVSDDGSRDETLSIILGYKDRLGSARVDVRGGPRQGLVHNFLGLACDPSIKCDYFAYSDQDDIWEPDKLSRAVEWLQTLRSDLPAMYCSRTRLIDEDGRACGFSPLFRREPNFRNALVQSIAGGNTMVFNQAARQLLADCGSDVGVPLHDWWTYLVITAAGGKVRYDPRPSIQHRGHSQNVVGSNIGWLNRVRRLQMLAAGDFEGLTELNVLALAPFRPRMTPENRMLFDLFCASRKCGFFGRQIGFLKTGVYRQTLLGNLALVLAVLAKKI